MAKRPTISTLTAAERRILNGNFKAIAEKFDEMLSRAGETPNHMEVDLDIADANITNTTRVEVNAFLVQDAPFTGFSDQYVYQLGLLSCTSGAILTHNAAGEPICLAPAADDLVLKTSGTVLAWEEDLDTDTDTVGVTVQEDGVTIAENVTTIDFKLAGRTLVTTPASNQVDLDLNELLGPLFEDTTQNDTNLYHDFTGSGFWQSAGETVRLDAETFMGGIPSSDNEFYIIAEASENLQDSGGLQGGTYGVSVRFYDNTGSATALTGVQIGQPGGEVAQRSDSIPSLHTVFCGVPAGTKYIDFYWLTSPLVPAATTYGAVSDRYRALIPASQRDSFTSPQGNGYAGGNFATVTPGP